MRRFLPELSDLIWTRQIDPGKVFDLTLRGPLEGDEINQLRDMVLLFQQEIGELRRIAAR